MTIFTRPGRLGTTGAAVLVAVTLACASSAFAAGSTVSAGRLTAQKTAFTIAAQTFTKSVTLSTATGGQDSWVDQDNATTNNGTATTLTVRSRTGNKNARGLVQFDLTDFAVPAGATVTSATLTMRATAGPASNRSYSLDRVSAAWPEGTVTWNNQPGVVAATTVTTAVTAASCTTGCNVSWTVTSDVAAWIAGGTNAGWRVKDQTEDATGGGVAIVFGASENATASNRPILSVTYTV